MSPSQIKLFGQTIYSQFPIQTHSNSSVSDDDHEKKKQFSSIEDDHNSSSVSNEVTKKPEGSELTKESNISNPVENPKTPSIETEPDLENNQSENNSKSTPTKPDKVIPCPRCNSLDTKFCYFNNYNLTQPRYFCKKCQRYWTSGGSMRNLAVGSGRRKNKNAFSSQSCQNVFSESIQASQAYGKFLDFSSNTHTNHCESFTLKPNFVEKSRYNFQNQFHEEQRKEFSSERSSINSSDSVGNGGEMNHVIQESFTPHPQNFPPIMFYQSPAHWGCFPYIYPPNCGSQILGKHSRENAMLSSPEENNLWFPKTLRIGDTSESTKSSIWSALGIKNEKNDCRIKKMVSKAFEPNEIYVRDNSLVLQANPAAFARSLNFRENA